MATQTDNMSNSTPTQNPFPTSSEKGAASTSMSGDQDLQGLSDKDLSSPLSSQAGPDILRRVVDGAHDAIDRLATSAAPHVMRLQDQVSEAGQALNDKASNLRAVRDEWSQSMRQTVRENPLASVAAALAVGLLIARLSR
jgi:ElaB/YqjD/DUF883 family membrane-anchored ribosome-binding protein